MSEVNTVFNNIYSTLTNKIFINGTDITFKPVFSFIKQVYPDLVDECLSNTFDILDNKFVVLKIESASNNCYMDQIIFKNEILNIIMITETFDLESQESQMTLVDMCYEIIRFILDIVFPKDKIKGRTTSTLLNAAPVILVMNTLRYSSLDHLAFEDYYKSYRDNEDIPDEALRDSIDYSVSELLDDHKILQLIEQYSK